MSIETNQDDDVPNEQLGWIVSALDYPTFRLSLVSKAMDRYSLRQFAEHGINYAEWRVISRLASVPAGATVGQIAELARVDRAEVSRAATALEKRGLTARRENPSDGRTPILHVTNAGMDLYRPMLAERRAFHESLVGSLTDEERKQFDEFLAKIAQRLVLIQKDGVRT